MKSKRGLRDQIDKLKKEHDQIVDTVGGLDIGSDEHENAIKSIESTTKALCEMEKTESESKARFWDTVWTGVRTVGEIALGVIGYVLYKTITRDEAIDEAGGFIPSQAVKNDRRAVKDIAIKRLK